ncbi:MAG: leucine-rich repeat protein, partial [Lachnospiraceae bacterium]|nr:leucine-rich repeat protein [Lachnospiraceae bacterium]
MRKRIISVALALCLCISSTSMAYASQGDPMQQEDALTEQSASKLAARDSTIPTPTEAYEAMIALKDQDKYKEGTTWTNDEPYSDSKGYYHWKGGTLDGKNISAVGCVAFAFILSDAAFGSLPARMYAAGKFTYEDIKAGDILRVNNDSHTVIVLEASDVGVVVAEGNISTGDHRGKVHWGRAISKEEVMSSTSHYITRYPEGYVPPDDPGANVPIAQGTLAGGLRWNLTKAGTLTISGKGAMPDFASTEEQPWNDKSSQIRKIILENGVTNIGSCAFWNCGVLSAEIPSSVTSIGNSAFRGSSIISVTIPSNVKTLGDSVFQDCQNLSSVTISEGLETISQNAFRACSSLSSIVLPASIGEVGAAAFFQCQKLIRVAFTPGNKQVKLGENIFTRCYYLSSVTLPKSINQISEGMFQNCLMLATLEIPQGAESIESSAFASCSSLTSIIIPNSVTTIGFAAFSASALRDIYFTGTQAQWNSVRKLGDTMTAVSKMTIHYNYVPEKADISKATVTLEKTSYTYDGSAKTPAVTVNLDGKTLIPNTDYSVSYNNNTAVGTANVSISGMGNYSGNVTAHFTITKADISKAAVSLEKTSYTYDGSAKTPAVTVNLNGKTLVRNTDYSVSYNNNTAVGTANVIITGMGNYTGRATANFTITKADISKAAVSLEETSYTYDGSAKTPAVTVTLNGKTLVLNTDYSVSYNNNIEVGTADVSISGMGNYTSSVTAHFTITKAVEVVKADISKATVTLEETSYTYDGSAKTPAVTVNLDGKTLVLNTDYSVSYSNNIEVGTADVSISGMGNYTGSATAHFTITKADISKAAVTLEETSYTYDGSAKTPAVTVTLDGKTLILNTDYSVSYNNNTAAGTANVSISGMGNYSGSVTTNFTITKADISEAAVTLEKSSFTYDGSAKTPAVTVSLNGKTLLLNTDYSVSYNNNIEVGPADVSISGMGNYSGSV